MPIFKEFPMRTSGLIIITLDKELTTKKWEKIETQLAQTLSKIKLTGNLHSDITGNTTHFTKRV